MLKKIVVLGVALGLVVSGVGLSQANTGKLTGRVTSQGDPLPGVTITATSPNLQGTRITTTSPNGDYVLPQLPAGDYEMVFELDSFQPVRKAVKVSSNQTSSIDQQMSLSEVTEEIVVTGEVGTISGEIASQTTYEKELVEQLAVSRSIEQAVLLAPGVHASGPKNGAEEGFAISVAGAQSYETLFMVNGVTVNENIRGQAREFIIQDAVQETTVMGSGISAEYGRFAGGVVNVITKSGGNDFHGSFRVNVDKEAWEGRTPLTPVDQDNTQNETYEATFGGRILRDRLWFFAAGRDLTRADSSVLPITNIQIDQTAERERNEGKLTISPHQSHRLIGAFQERDSATANNHFAAIDLSTVNAARADPEELWSMNYTGVLTDKFFVEAQYSERDYTIGSGSGGTTHERIGGSWIVDLTTFTFIGSPVFCAICKDQQRNNENGLIKASYFLSTDDAGSHDVVAGYDTYSDIVIVENHQSASDFSIWAFQPFIVRGQEVFPQFTPNGSNRLRWDPVFNPTQGTDFKVDALYVNDNWRLNDKWNFNLGLRYNENEAIDAGGALVSDDAKLSPRLGVAYDLKGDGSWVFNASLGEYTHTVHTGGNIGNGAAGAGALTTFQWRYGGPAINPDPNAPDLLNADEALAVIFNWFSAIGDVDNVDQRISLNIPGVGTQVQQSLITPGVQEFTVGATKRLGNKGLVRADYVRRDYDDFYVTRVDTGTGRVQNPDGTFSDLNLLENNDSALERVYDGLHTQFAYRPMDRLNIFGNWTWSHARGTWNGETEGNGPVTSGILAYPELKAFSQALPRGDLHVDQRHKVLLAGIYNVLQGEHNQLSVSLLHRFNTGHPIVDRGVGGPGAVDSGAFLDIGALGYLEDPPTVDYWFFGRDQFRTEDIHRTDIAINYSFQWNVFGKEFDIFLQPEILNVLNENGVVFADDTVLDATVDSARFATFNPFTDTPVRGTHFDVGPNFGQALAPEDFQAPRTFRFSVGFRF